MRNPGNGNCYKTKTEGVLLIACGDVVPNGIELIFFSRIATSVSVYAFQNLNDF